MPHGDFSELLHAFSARVEAGDAAGFAALFTEDGVYCDRFYGRHQGRPAIEALLRRFHAEGERFHWRFHTPLEAGGLGYASFLYAYTAKTRHAAGRRVALRGISRFHLRGGLIADYDDAFESGIMLAQLGSPGEVMAKLFGRWAVAASADAEIRRLLEE
jgi:ketosteroid isomerase-like protein